MIWATFAILALVAFAIVLHPLRMAGAGILTRNDTVPKILADQMQEVQRDLDRGLISEAEAQAAQLEIKKRILSTLRQSESAPVNGAAGGRKSILIAAIFAPVFAVVYYTTMGSPDIPSLAFAERTEERTQNAEVTELASRMRERLETDPDGGPSEGWMLLGQTYQRMGRLNNAITAFEVVAKRPDASSATFSMLAEAVVIANDGVVIPKAQRHIDRALELDPKNPAATYFRALYFLQQEQPRKSYDLLLSRLNEEVSFAPWMEVYAQQINRIAAEKNFPAFQPPMARAQQPGPTAADVAAAADMTEEDRANFIRSMVSRLAARLEDEPEDLDGWMRLANAYNVLQERSLAIEAYQKAQALLEEMPSDDPRNAVVREALEQLGG
ncbi:c-type cytochrome biogenesis protein CcmI [Mesobacterium pallidum]|uniref:c-type cytochrome biogenesis protein CcmI n=1 Tax=Mesobacterium pallidum TaxID=2872037 RepID=UPI001EE1C142|nr:c-type cytochrome biogenesis protein CcmI [Mesobacterium pallidum]